MNEDTSYLFTIIGGFHLIGIILLCKVTSKLLNKSNEENIKLINNTGNNFLNNKIYDNYIKEFNIV